MKKILGLLFAVFAVFTLAACGDKEFKHDGQFTAFEVSAHKNSVQVTEVTVTIKKGKIASYYIDELQSTFVEETFTWNEKTKKELKEDYGMTVVPGTIQVEWYLQAEAIEAKWLANGIDSVELDSEGYINNMADATMIGDVYNKLAHEAVNKAKKGIATAYEVSVYNGVPQITWVEAKFEKGKVVSYYIDELQSKVVEDAVVWNEKTKKELKEDYGMTVVPGTIQVEWYLQAEAIEAKWLADGIDSVELDSEGYINNMADATMVGDVYNKLAKAAKALVK